MSLSKLQEVVKDREVGYATVKWLQRVKHDLVAEQQFTQVKWKTHIHTKPSLEYLKQLYL